MGLYSETNFLLLHLSTIDDINSMVKRTEVCAYATTAEVEDATVRLLLVQAEHIADTVSLLGNDKHFIKEEA